VPTILRLSGYRVIIYTSDHRPAHVHVRGAGKEALFYLNCPDGPPEVRGNFRFNTGELTRIQVKLIPHVVALCAAWKEMHGYN